MLEATPLSDLFVGMVDQTFRQDVAVRAEGLTDYVAGLLVDFTRAEQVFRIRDTRGRPIEDVAEMLIASNPLLDAPNFEREREVRKHVGDFTLFFSGMYPESIGKWRLRQLRVGSFVDYIQAGKESYGVVAAFDQFEYTRVAPLFRKLSESFEECVYGLHLVRKKLDAQLITNLIH